ncbi:hypothetical protein COCMIDRAFT_41860 [Bipolaris oryzae ATCC 44560]|uniref:BTB domain-containing protein n=1 Tax=Bipolaris oryzae ATCC 44560 TaxID=930090 RepID=W6YPT0_COCMI|nr:uncharacterized protein COCMIDRAFT_41860 [Bipolaris oryzae ATCC 44560]EUC39650.1 hypothetical protein COCMIDRAFT_41860 [Bipolaris oryzae ATCC 44560]
MRTQRRSTKQTFTKACSIMGETIPVSIQGGQIHVHTEVLTSTSDFLKNAMKPEWRADKNCPIDLSGEDPKVVESYCQWLYSGKIVRHGNSKSISKSMCRLFVLGESLMDRPFKNAVLDSMMDGIHSKPKFHATREGVKIIYEGTPKGSPARRLLVDMWAYLMTARRNLDNLVSLRGTDFFEELIPALIAVRSVPHHEKVRPWVAKPESYYEGAVADGINIVTDPTGST